MTSILARGNTSPLSPFGALEPKLSRMVWKNIRDPNSEAKRNEMPIVWNQAGGDRFVRNSDIEPILARVCFQRKPTFAN